MPTETTLLDKLKQLSNESERDENGLFGALTRLYEEAKQEALAKKVSAHAAATVEEHFEQRAADAEMISDILKTKLEEKIKENSKYVNLTTDEIISLISTLRQWNPGELSHEEQNNIGLAQGALLNILAIKTWDNLGKTRRAICNTISNAIDNPPPEFVNLDKQAASEVKATLKKLLEEAEKIRIDLDYTMEYISNKAHDNKDMLQDQLEKISSTLLSKIKMGNAKQAILGFFANKLGFKWAKKKLQEYDVKVGAFNFLVDQGLWGEKHAQQNKQLRDTISALSSSWTKLINKLNNTKPSVESLKSLYEFREALSKALVENNLEGSPEDIFKIINGLQAKHPDLKINEQAFLALDKLAQGAAVYPRAKEVLEAFSGNDNLMSERYNKTLSLLNRITSMYQSMHESKPPTYESKALGSELKLSHQFRTWIEGKITEEAKAAAAPRPNQ